MGAVIFICLLLSFADYQELARQNKITKQILEAFIQKKLGLRSTFVRPPSISDILPVKMPSEERTVRQSQRKEKITEPVQETQEYTEDDNLQSVESEQIDSVYDTEGMYNFFNACLYFILS